MDAVHRVKLMLSGASRASAERSQMPAKSIRPAKLKIAIDDELARRGEPGPTITLPTDHGALVDAIARASTAYPIHYQERFCTPLLTWLRGPGREVDVSDERDDSVAWARDACRAALQRPASDTVSATRAMQEVAADLYDGFVGAAARRGVLLPRRFVLAPLTGWSPPIRGPHTWTVEQLASFRLPLGAAVVALPVGYAGGGVLGWATLAHEVAGHDLLAAEGGLLRELGMTVAERARGTLGGTQVRLSRTEFTEIASDVLGILNMGPTAALGVIGYLRASRWRRGDRRLSAAPVDDHPPDLLRALVCAQVIERLDDYRRAMQWGQWLREHIASDLAYWGGIQLTGARLSVSDAQVFASILAQVIAEHPTDAFEGHALRQIQRWDDHDDQLVDLIREALRTDQHTLPTGALEGPFAAHAVAAAVAETVFGDLAASDVFERMIAMLSAMHAANPAWRRHGAPHRGDHEPRAL